MAKNQMRCCSCGKLLAEEVSVQSGFIRITCACGVSNEVTVKKEKSKQKEKAEYNRFPTDWNARL